MIMAGALAMVMAYPHMAGAEALWVSFHSASIKPAPSRRAVQAQPIPVVKPSPLRGLLEIPKGKGPFPAVVLMHDCRGLRHFQREWVRKLANLGYVALLVGSFYTRKVGAACTRTNTWTGLGPASRGIADVYGALNYLAGLTQVDNRRIGLLSWDRDNALSIVHETGFQVLSSYRFATAVAVTPSCRRSVSGRFYVPVLILSAANDDWSSATICARMAKAGQAQKWPVEVQLYPGVGHGFDDPLLREGVFLNAVYNPNKTPPLGATLRYNRKAHKRSVVSIQKFLQKYLHPDATAGVASARVQGTWVVDPHQVGSNLPAVGRSLFDRLFTRQGIYGPYYDVPFPLDRVLDAIRSQLGDKPVAISNGYGPASDGGIRITLIPLGRSLQRFAAAPDFFASPRVVIAVDGEPGEIAPGQTPLRLNDRLFLGYQEQAKVLEVISYNEQAGRFEFQVVDNYAQGLEPKVYYANRSVCRSCHQNGSPIFSKAGWDETNANPLIAERLGEISKSFYGIGFRSGAVGPAAVDNATDRANLFSVQQLMWRKVCGNIVLTQRRCRAAALIAILQQRLSASTGFDHQTRRYREDFAATVKANWLRLWPSGLLVPNPNIPNREPLLNESPAAIPAELDPLRLRPPLAVLKVEDRKHLEQLVSGLAEDFPEADMLVLDQELFAHGRLAVRTPRYRLKSDCKILRLGSTSGISQLQFDCRNRSSALQFQGAITLLGRQVHEGTVWSIELDANSYYSDLVLLAGQISKNDRHWQADLEIRHRGSLHYLRLTNGHAVERLRLSWPAEPESERAVPTANKFSGTLEVQMMDDFAPVIRAVKRLRDQGNGSALPNVFDADRFDAVNMLQRLMPALGFPVNKWCCAQPKPMPVALAHSEITATAEFSRDLKRHGALNTFIRNCGRCHRTQMTQPPNYLEGDKSAVTRKIAHCAERIFVRLSMWDLDIDERPKSPMPPPHSFKATGASAQVWRNSQDRATLKAYVSEILKAERGGIPTVRALLANGYDATRRCLKQRVSGVSKESS